MGNWGGGGSSDPPPPATGLVLLLVLSMMWLYFPNTIQPWADPGFLKMGGGPSYRFTSKKGGPRGGPTLGPMLKGLDLQRRPKRDPLDTPPPRIRPCNQRTYIGLGVTHLYVTSRRARMVKCGLGSSWTHGAHY